MNSSSVCHLLQRTKKGREGGKFCSRLSEAKLYLEGHGKEHVKDEQWKIAITTCLLESRHLIGRA